MTNEEKLAYLTSLEKMIFDGVLSTEYNGQKVTFRSMNELIKARDILKKSLGTKRKTRILTVFSGGL